MIDFSVFANRILTDSHAWLITGKAGSGKEDFFLSLQSAKTVLVSLEVASCLIEEERKNDDSEFIEGGVDIGRTAGSYIAEVLHDKKSFQLKDSPEVQLCGIQPILNRGLKYLSTGEIRRTLLCRALLSHCPILLLSDPFAGLDIHSHRILFDFFNSIVAKKIDGLPRLILCTERFCEIPPAITYILEFSEGNVSFCGICADYKAELKKRARSTAPQKRQKRSVFLAELDVASVASAVITKDIPIISGKMQSKQLGNLPTNQLASKTAKSHKKELVSFKNVSVAWGGHKVLNKIDWVLYEGEHWLIRGPNGSGKTTVLELITGDNTQVYSNDIRIFGRKRGTGETIWDIKKKLGIVSYRLHLEYRMLGNTDIEAVILSGFYDSIGLYQPRSQLMQDVTQKWLRLMGFEKRKTQSFLSLSYGEQRAVLIIRAAIKSSPILILDEPCHGLDDEWRNKIFDLMDYIAKEEKSTLLHVTHDPTEVRPFEKHILELHPNESPMYKIIRKF